MCSRKNHPTQAYLLRCWQEEEAVAGKEPPWRFSLEEVLQKQPRRGFGSLDALVAFLQAELSSGDETAGRGPG